MIDIWLVLCQMVPFFNVVLITAMEVNREDEVKEDFRDARSAVVLFIDKEPLEEIDCRKEGIWHRQLRTVGRFLNINCT